MGIRQRLQKIEQQLQAGSGQLFLGLPTDAQIEVAATELQEWHASICMAMRGQGIAIAWHSVDGVTAPAPDPCDYMPTRGELIARMRRCREMLQ